jgi:hypothetical protein
MFLPQYPQPQIGRAAQQQVFIVITLLDAVPELCTTLPIMYLEHGMYSSSITVYSKNSPPTLMKAPMGFIPIALQDTSFFLWAILIPLHKLVASLPQVIQTSSFSHRQLQVSLQVI